MILYFFFVPFFFFFLLGFDDFLLHYAYVLFFSVFVNLLYVFDLGYPMFHANPLPISACLRLVVIRLKHILGEKKSTFSYAHPPHSMILMSSFISSCLSFSCLLWLSSLSQKFLNICVPGGSVVNLPANE